MNGEKEEFQSEIKELRTEGELLADGELLLDGELLRDGELRADARERNIHYQRFLGPGFLFLYNNNHAFFQKFLLDVTVSLINYYYLC